MADSGRDPMTPPRRAKLVLLALAVALVGLGVWRGEVLWEWATIGYYWSQQNLEGSSLAVLLKRNRWTGRHSDGGVAWFRSTGFRAYEIGEEGVTRWNPDGTLYVQQKLGDPVKLLRTRDPFTIRPPWWWDMTDQTAPSAPAWILDDAKWQAALDAHQAR